MMKRLLLLLLPLLLIALVVGCYGKTDVEEEGVFKCDTSDECVSGFECRLDPAKGSTVTQKFCMRVSADQNTDCIDHDGDGYGTKDSKDFLKCGKCKEGDQEVCKGKKLDCDDNSKYVHPDALELCDGVDNNCVDGIDEPPDKTCEVRTACGPRIIKIGTTSYRVECENKKCVVLSKGGAPLVCKDHRYEPAP